MERSPTFSMTHPDWLAAPATLREKAVAALDPGENIVGSLVCQVDGTLRYAPTLLVLTNLRFLAVSPGDSSIAEWLIGDIERISSRDRAGLGSLELIGHDRQLAVWHYTLNAGPAVLRLLDHFDELRAIPGENIRPAEDADIPTPEETLPPPTTKALFRLAVFARPHFGYLLLGFLLSCAATAAALVPNIVTGGIYDNVLIPYGARAADLSKTPEGAETVAAALPQTGTLIAYLAIFIGAITASWLLGWAQGAILAYVGERVTADLRNATYAHLQKLSLEYFGAKRTGDLMSRISTDSDRLCQFLSDSVVDFAADCLLIAFSVAFMLSRDPMFAIVSLIPFPFMAYTLYLSRDKLQTGFQSSGRAWGNVNSVLADTIPGIRVVKAFAQEDREIGRFDTANRLLVQANDRVNSVWTFFWPLIIFLNQLGVVVVWAFGIYRVYEGAMTPGDLLIFAGLTTKFYGRLESMSRMVNASQRAGASAQRIFEVLDHVSTVPEPAKPVPLTKLRGTLEFRNVGFRYGNRKVIHDLNLKIDAGEMVGLVGHTGAGKSTLINLVCRFFDVAEGAILADGIDIRSYRLERYRRNVGIVLQEPFLFYGTIAENIAYGRPDATRRQIIEAADAARAHEFILQLPDGYDSVVGERGQSLSGGERQRISIARALLIDPRILILDEATSAVDTQTEREIQEALANLVKGRTTIAIAHRLSTLRQANRIVVLDRGRLVEAGTHEDLLKMDGSYAKLVRAQQQLTKDIGW